MPLSRHDKALPSKYALLWGGVHKAYSVPIVSLQHTQSMPKLYVWAVLRPHSAVPTCSPWYITLTYCYGVWTRMLINQNLQIFTPLVKHYTMEPLAPKMTWYLSPLEFFCCILTGSHLTSILLRF